MPTCTRIVPIIVDAGGNAAGAWAGNGGMILDRTIYRSTSISFFLMSTP